MRAYAVIGASYGDEGKGRTADWLAAPHGPDALVVRSNGGAQAAHTVQREDGVRHVFHHIGSASFRGSRTHLSRFMVSHPILFAEELAALRQLGAAPKVSADPRGLVTTPWDMMVNQAVEIARGGTRHGSCGLGFGETVGRFEEAGSALRVGDLLDDGLAAKLISIRNDWLPLRLAELGLQRGEGPLEFAQSDQLLDHFMQQCSDFTRAVDLRADADIGSESVVIFEAAQGLLLDRDGADFPFLTRSKTGIANIRAIAQEAQIETIEPVYVTRCYLTRHGRGPMEDERNISAWFDVDDPTNRPNPWQESLRFGLLDPAKLAARVKGDLLSGQGNNHTAIALTCCDQAIGSFAWIEGGRIVEGPLEELAATFDRLGFAVTQFSSPSNDAVTAARRPRDGSNATRLLKGKEFTP